MHHRPDPHTSQSSSSEDEDEVLELLDKPPSDRTESDIDQIVRYCLDIPFFARGVRYSQFSKEVLRSICRELLVEDFDKNTIVFRQGDVGDKFYVVYEGECSVLIDEHDSDEMSQETAELAKAQTPIPPDPTKDGEREGQNTPTQGDQRCCKPTRD